MDSLSGYKNPVEYLRRLKSEPEEKWIRRGEDKALRLFHSMAERVPAYKDFLKKNKVNSDKITSANDFKNIPTVCKNSYLKHYPRASLCWDGEFEKKRWVISTTSGSTGEPYYFPREDIQDQQYANTAEMYLLNNFQIDKKSTLYIDGFAMGAWIGGLFTYQAIKHLSVRGKYNLSIITPGIFKAEIIKAVKNLGHEFDQVIIGGYPPMIKDTIDDGIKEGVNWKKYNLKFIFSAEGFSEKFRDYIYKQAGLKNIYLDTLNHYGTVDLGTMAHETPITILIRRLIEGKSKQNESFFNSKYHLPTLVQYDPSDFYFQAENDNLICSANSGIPLFRYDLKDLGSVYTRQELVDKFAEFGKNLNKIVIKTNINDTLLNLPFVYVHERRDFIVKLYGANIYPDTVRKALQHQSLHKYFTGKFTMEIKYDNLQNQYLEINIEMKNEYKINNAIEKKAKQIIISKLLKENSEYRSNFKESSTKQEPHLIFWPYEDAKYFRSGGKQKWVK